MKKKLIKIALTGRTNSGKSSLFNSLLGKKISIINKKINTTNDLITGIINIQETQIILYDTPGTNYLSKKISFNKNFRSNIWNAIDHSDLIMYLVDSKKFNLTNTINDLINFIIYRILQHIGSNFPRLNKTIHKLHNLVF